MDLTLFAERLREVRRDLKMNQEDFSAMIKVSRASLSFYETAARTPDIKMLRNLCEATGISAYYFLGMSDNKYEETGHEDGAAIIQLLIDNQQTLEVVPVVHAHWVHPIRGNVGSYCSHCKRSTERLESGTYFEPDYCPHCGAKMDEATEDNPTD